MNQYMNLTKRNCLVFLRDRSAVFFSLLSMLIVLMLMAVFLGNLSVDGIKRLLLEYGGERDRKADAENAKHLIQYWTLAGILITNAVTVSLSSMSTMVRDKAEKKLDSFYCAPVSEFTIAVSYITASVLLGILLCTVPMAAALAYIVATGGEMLTFAAIVKLFGCMFVNVFIFSIIMYLAAELVKSTSAWSGLGTIVGTLVGFVGGIYLPMGELPERVGTVLKYIPILHSASLMRKICCADIISKTFEGLPDRLVSEWQEAMGVQVVMGQETVSSGFQLGFLLICGMIALAWIFVINRRQWKGTR